MSTKQNKLSRRVFLTRIGTLTAAGAAASLAGCSTSQQQEPQAQAPMIQLTPVPVIVQYPEVPYTPMAPPPNGQLQVFTPQEARMVEALTARILPGTPDDPGAREAGVVFYIDTLLAYNEGFNEPTYRTAPFVQTFDPANPPQDAVTWYQANNLPLPQPSGDQSQATNPTPAPATVVPTPTIATAPTPEPGVQPSGINSAAPTPVAPNPAVTASAGYQVVWVPGAEIERYGYQSVLSPREVYRIGLAAVDRYANGKFGGNFADLNEQQQDAIIADMANGDATGFDRALSGTAFFHTLRRHTAEGMFADPVYGGNRDMVGWKLVGFPGAQRAYDVSEYQREGTNRQPQSIMDMMPFAPGQDANDEVILPVSGSQPDLRQPAAPPAERTAVPNGTK